MNHRIPILPTLVVGFAVCGMIALGLWQIGRLAEKEDMLRTYAEATDAAAPVPFPTGPEAVARHLYRRSSLICEEVLDQRVIAGRGADGQSGMAVQARCRTNDYGDVDIVLGIAADTEPVAWKGGPVRGIIAPGMNGTARLFAEPPVGGLSPLARPDPADLPNNHLSYAVQWFLFAVTAVVIYVLALRSKWRREDA